MSDTGANEPGSTQVATALQTHLDHLEKPLRYATRQNFAHLARLRDLEAYVQHHVQAIQAAPLPPELLSLLQQLLQAVQGVDALPLPQKQARVQQAEQVLARMRASTSHATAPSPAAATVQVPARATAPLATSAPKDTTDPCAQPVQFLRGVGPRRAALLAKMSFHTVHDLLWCLPMRYEDRRQLTPLGLLRWGKRETFCGRVTTLQTQPGKRGRPFVALLLQDDSGVLSCKWFQTRSTYLQERFPVGTRVVGSGMVTLNGYTGTREVVHPDLEVLDADDTEQVHFGRVVPIYPLTAGLHQKAMRSLMKQV
ncbi:MAG TPA: OB-fold nucleic acid binding domain-containing protein, partial [Candidatus Tectomicrobia bacterium]